MSCFSPVPAWRSANKSLDNGKYQLSFKRGAYAIRIDLPCGKCLGCRADQAREWTIRASHEASLHDRNAFLTLTYADPAPATLQPDDLQKFWKRLRHKTGKLRYIACGEYGELYRRPHYHAIVFGEDFLGGAISLDDSSYTQPDLARAWGHGFVSVAPVEFGSIAYVCGYVTKKVGDPDTFSRMSRNPGIGHDWLDRYYDDIVRTGFCVVNGREFPVPKRYLVWKECELSDVKEERSRYFLEHPERVSFKKSTIESRRINKTQSVKQRSPKL